MKDKRKKEIIDHIRKEGVDKYSPQEFELLTYLMFERTAAIDYIKKYTSIKNVSAIVSLLRNKGHFITNTAIDERLPAYEYHGHYPEMAKAYSSKELDQHTALSVIKSIMNSFPAAFESIADKVHDVQKISQLNSLLNTIPKRKLKEGNKRLIYELVLKAIFDFKKAIELREMVKNWDKKKAYPNDSEKA